MNHSQIEEGVRLILRGLECDTRDRNFAETPERVARAYEELFSPPYTEYKTFEEKYADLIILRDHTIWTLCPHHLLPVRMVASVAYIPNGEVLGLSKLARVLNDCNTGPCMQEAFTRAVVDRLGGIARNNRGVACLVTGTHDCMRIRGVRSKADVTTLTMTGEFQSIPSTQATFLAIVRRDP